MNDPMSALPQNPLPVAETPAGVTTFGQLLDRIWRILRGNFKLLFAIATVPAGTIVLVLATVFGTMFAIMGPHLGGSSSARPPIPPLGPLELICGVYLVFPFLYALYLPAAIYAAQLADRRTRVSFGDAYGKSLRHFGRHLWLMVLCVLCVVLPVFVAMGLIVGSFLLIEHGSGLQMDPARAFFLLPLVILLYIGILVYCVLLGIRLALAFPACVEEDLPAWEALKRSWQLTQGAMGRIFLVLLLVYAITYAVNLVCIAVLLMVGGLGGLAAMLAHVHVGSVVFFIFVGLAALAYLAVILVSILISYAAGTTAVAVLYHDQRVRKDGATTAPAPAG